MTLIDHQRPHCDAWSTALRSSFFIPNTREAKLDKIEALTKINEKLLNINNQRFFNYEQKQWNKYNFSFKLCFCVLHIYFTWWRFLRIKTESSVYSEFFIQGIRDKIVFRIKNMWSKTCERVLWTWPLSLLLWQYPLNSCLACSVVLLCSSVIWSFHLLPAFTPYVDFPIVILHLVLRTSLIVPMAAKLDYFLCFTSLFGSLPIFQTPVTPLLKCIILDKKIKCVTIDLCLYCVTGMHIAIIMYRHTQVEAKTVQQGCISRAPPVQLPPSPPQCSACLDCRLVPWVRVSMLLNREPE